MHNESRVRTLTTALAEFEIVDTHEHLVREEERVAMPVDVFTLFRGYCMYNLELAGLPHDDAFVTIFDPRIPVEDRWRLVAPYWPRIRSTSYARALRITLRDLYGCEELSAETVGPLSAAIRRANVPGLYRQILIERCRIRTALTLPIPCTTIPAPAPMMSFLINAPFAFLTTPDRAEFMHPFIAPDETITSLDAFLTAQEAYLTRAREAGIVGLKIGVQPDLACDRAAAARAFAAVVEAGDGPLPDTTELRAYLVDQAVGTAAALGMVIAVHTGYWGDFRRLHPLQMIPMAQRHPGARFDVFHLGYPWVRDTLMLAKGFPNIWLNLCWTHLISPAMAVEAMTEAIDLLPDNKVLGFGGDYWTPVEKIYGHLVLARENLARALDQCISTGRLTEEDALSLAHRWLWTNPVELYRLPFAP